MTPQSTRTLVLVSLLSFALSALGFAKDEEKRAPGSDPYTLTTCPVSGGALGSMGDPLVKVYDGREVRFCCGGCVGDFEGAKDEHFKKIDAALIADQKPHYGLKVCPVSGTSLVKDGKDVGIDLVIGNQLVRVCSEGCAQKAQSKAKKLLAKVKAALAELQREHYALTTCPVSGGKLGGMGKPVEIVVASRLIRLCCKGCLPKVEAKPSDALSKVDAAHGKHGEGKPESGKSGEHDHSKHKH